MKRGVGCSRILNRNRDRDRIEKVSNELLKEKQESLTKVCNDLQDSLKLFIKKYKRNINQDPEFRLKFLELCSLLGIDPLCSNNGYWGKMIGLSSFYTELLIKILEISINTRLINGGLCGVNALLSTLSVKYNINTQDIKRAVEMSKVFGESAARVLTIGDEMFVVTSSINVSTDQMKVLDFASKVKRGVSVREVSDQLDWSQERSFSILNFFIQQQMAWIDVQVPRNVNDFSTPVITNTLYWFPSLF